MNNILCAEYSEEEVKTALNNIGDLKSPGPDGMPSVFYERFWHTVGEHITKQVLNVLRGGQMPEHWNDTLVVLILKKYKRKNIEGPATHKSMQCYLQNGVKSNCQSAKNHTP
jgi:hypothetical protein